MHNYQNKKNSLRGAVLISATVGLIGIMIAVGLQLGNVSSLQGGVANSNSAPPISISELGSPMIKHVNFTNTGSSISFVSSEVVTLLVNSSVPQESVRLSMDNLPAGVWANISRSLLTSVSATGQIVHLTLSGAVILPGVLPSSSAASNTNSSVAPSNQGSPMRSTIYVMANSTTLSSGQLPFEITPTGFGMSETNGSSPISLSTNSGLWSATPNMASYMEFGAVANSPVPLLVQFKVLGLYNSTTGELVSMPSWITISSPELGMLPFTPSYFQLAATIGTAPAGLYTLGVQESINQHEFVQYFQIQITSGAR